MKIKSLIYPAIAALVAGFSFTACDQNNNPSGEVVLEVASNTLEFEATESTLNLQFTSSDDWTASVDADWVGINPTSGSGDISLQTIEVTVLANTGFDREAKITIEAAKGLEVKTVTVAQKGKGSAAMAVVYHNDLDKAVVEKVGTSWPYADQTEDWKNETGTGLANLSYDVKGISVRSNSPSSGSYSDYEGSGNNNLLFSSNNHLQISNLTLGDDRSYTLSFGTEKYVYDAEDNTFDHSEFLVYVSADNTKWVSLEYSFPNGDKNGRWDKASTTFTLPANVKTLSIYFKSTLSGAHRLDDIDLSVSSVEGTAIDFTNGTELDSNSGGGTDTPDEPVETADPITVTVAEFLAAEVSNSQPYQLTGVIGGSINTTYGNFDLTDGTGTVYVYGLTATNLGYGVSNDKSYSTLGLKEGDTVTIIGYRGDYQGKSEVVYAYYVSHVAGEGGTDTPDEPVETADPITVTVAEFLAAEVSSTQPYQLTGVIGGSINTTYGNFDLTDETGTVYVYGLTATNLGYGASNDKSYSTLGLQEGDTVTIIGYRGDYNGKSEVVSAYYVSHEAGEGGSEGGDDTPVEGNVVVFDRSEVTISGNSTAGEQTVVYQGVTLTVSNGILGGTTDSPAEYRIYKGQTLTVSATSTIVSVKFDCTASDTAKYGPGNLHTENESEYTYSGTVGTWTGSASSIVFSAVENQVRATKITVVLAE